MNANINALKGSVVKARWFDRAASQWWDGAARTDVELDAEASTLTVLVLSNEFENKYVGIIAEPVSSGDWVLEYFTDPDMTIIGEEAVNSITTTVTMTQGDIDAIASSIAAASGTGDTAVDHDTGGTDNLRFTTSDGTGIDNAEITIYLKADYDAGNTDPVNLLATSRTRADGRWASPVYLDAGLTYTIVFYKQGLYSISTAEVTV